MLRYALIAILMLLALPAGAGEQVQHIGHDGPLEQAIGKSALHSLLNQALDLIENHIEIKANLQPNEDTGDRQGHFQLKLYPHGKSQSDDHVSAELQFLLAQGSALVVCFETSERIIRTILAGTFAIIVLIKDKRRP